MLCLDRRKSQVIRIGDEIEIKVLLLKEGYVKLGINAPKHLRIVRDELEPLTEPQRKAA
jgi:carbon storage regulator